MSIRVLVVDDSAVVRQVITALLSQDPQVSVAAAADPIIAMEKMKRARPDVIILDLQMPRMDGLELCRRIRAAPKVASTPVILVTSLDKPEEKLEGLEAGADAYISKASFDQETLLGTIRQLIGKAVSTVS